MPNFDMYCENCNYEAEHSLKSHNQVVYCPTCSKEGRDIPLQKRPSGFNIRGSGSGKSSDRVDMPSKIEIESIGTFMHMGEAKSIECSHCGLHPHLYEKIPEKGDPSLN